MRGPEMEAIVEPLPERWEPGPRRAGEIEL